MQENLCGAKTRSGACCKNAAMPNGRCRMHGGRSLQGIQAPTFKHGRYSKYLPETLQEKVDEFDAHDLLDLADELQAQRALIAQYIERYQKSGNMTEGAIAQVISWFNSVGVMVERIMKMRNETALTSAELAFLKMRTADLVVKYIDNPEKRKAFVIELFQISEPAQLK